MKICPECAAEYDERVNFCANDGKSLVAKTEVRARLCPHCANSIAESAVRCPYCKADFAPAQSQQWPARGRDGEDVKTPTVRRGFSRSAKVVLACGLVLFAIGFWLVGKSLLTGRSDRGEFASLVEEKVKELQEREQQIQKLEGDLAQLRKELDDGAARLAKLTGKLEASQRELASTRERLGGALRENERSAARPAPSGSRGRVPASRRPAEPGLYETLRPTSVYDQPSGSSRVVSKIGKGTKITVVRSVGDWLEVRSRHGNPPGFIRWDDAMFVSRTN